MGGGRRESLGHMNFMDKLRSANPILEVTESSMTSESSMCGNTLLMKYKTWYSRSDNWLAICSKHGCFSGGQGIDLSL